MGLKVLACAPSNVAVDNLVERLAVKQVRKEREREGEREREREIFAHRVWCGYDEKIVTHVL